MAEQGEHMSVDSLKPFWLSPEGIFMEQDGEMKDIRSKSCVHAIEGEDYGVCRHCHGNFFRTSGGLWQSYDTGKQYIPTH